MATQTRAAAAAAHQAASEWALTRIPVACSGPVAVSNAASQPPSSAPAIAAVTASMPDSAAFSRVSCLGDAPRADSSADSGSRWPASTREASNSAAATSTSSIRPPMTSTDRETTRLRPMPLSRPGRPVVTCRPPYRGELRAEVIAVIFPASTVRLPPMRRRSGWATQDAAPVARAPRAKAPRSTTSGP